MRTSLMSTLELTCLVRTHKNAFFFTSTIEIVIYVQGRGEKPERQFFSLLQDLLLVVKFKFLCSQLPG